VKVDLVSGSEFISAARVQNLARSAAVREIAGIFEERIPRLGQLRSKCGLTGKVATCPSGWASRTQLDRPAVQFAEERAGPGQLQAGVVAVTGDSPGAAGKAQEKAAREIEVLTNRAKLVF